MGKFHRRSHNIVPTGIAAFVWSDGGHDPQAWENVAKNVGVKHRCSTVTEYYVKTWHPRLYYPFELKYCPRGPHTYDACLNYGILDPILSVPNPYNFPSFCQKLPNIQAQAYIESCSFFALSSRPHNAAGNLEPLATAPMHGLLHFVVCY